MLGAYATQEQRSLATHTTSTRIRESVAQKSLVRRRQSDILGLPLQAKMSPQEAHDFAVQIIGVLGEMFEKANEREKAGVAYEGARGLGTIMTVKLFDPPHYGPEQKLFGPLLERDFSKLLPPNP
jgi:hypothetical protein